MKDPEEAKDREAEEVLRELDELMAWSEANMHLMGTAFTEESLGQLKKDRDELREANEKVATWDRAKEQAVETLETEKRRFIEKYGQAAYDAVEADAKAPEYPH